MSVIAEVQEYASLDTDAYKHQALLLRSLHCARPVHVHGREAFIHTLTASLVGGHIEMTVYLTGDPAPVDCSQVRVERKP